MNEIDEYKKMLNTALAVGLPIIGKWTAARICFITYYWGGSHKKLCSLRNYLRRKGYEIPGRAGMAVYVTRETRRSAKMESKAEKLGMIIKIAA